jgi:hypothetical protein
MVSYKYPTPEVLSPKPEAKQQPEDIVCPFILITVPQCIKNSGPHHDQSMNPTPALLISDSILFLIQ